MEAWFEAGEISQAPWKWSRWNKYQKAMDDYLGPRSGQVPIFEDQLWCRYPCGRNVSLKHQYVYLGPLLTSSICSSQLQKALSSPLWRQWFPTRPVQLLLL